MNINDVYPRANTASSDNIAECIEINTDRNYKKQDDTDFRNLNSFS